MKNTIISFGFMLAVLGSILFNQITIAYIVGGIALVWFGLLIILEAIDWMNVKTKEQRERKEKKERNDCTKK